MTKTISKPAAAAKSIVSAHPLALALSLLAPRPMRFFCGLNQLWQLHRLRQLQRSTSVARPT
jgi:hypothetical protein